MPPPAPPGDSAGFCLLRHGQSEANVRKLIASSPAAAGAAFGLTDLGRQQVRDSVLAARAAGLLSGPCHVVSSPLLRARESAEIAADVLGSTLRIDARLAERGFGEFELGPDDKYERVWSRDRADPSHETWGVESTTSILRRVGTLVQELHDEGREGTFVLTTHGDVASVLLCADQRLALTQHRDVGALANGEVRRLSPDALSALSVPERA